MESQGFTSVADELYQTQALDADAVDAADAARHQAAFFQFFHSQGWLPGCWRSSLLHPTRGSRELWLHNLTTLEA